MLSSPQKQLRRVCDDAPFSPKILFVPNLFAGIAQTSCLARAGVDWTNLRVTTPVGLARDLMQVEIARRGGRMLDQDTGWLLASEVLAQRPEQATACYGRMGVSTPQALHRTLSDLRMGGIEPARLQSCEAGQMQALAVLLSEYERQLEKGNWWDDAATLQWAMQQPSVSDKDNTTYLILDETELSVREETFLLGLTDGRLQRIGRHDYGAESPSRWAHVRLSSLPISGDEPHSSSAISPESRKQTAASSLVQGDLFLDSLLLDSLLNDETKVTHERIDVGGEAAGRLSTTGLVINDSSTVRLWQTIGQESEIRAVLRDVLDRQLPLDDVEIAYSTAHDTYLPMLYDAVCRFDLPADFTRGVPISMTGGGRCLRSFLTWIEQDCDGLVLIDGLRSGDINWAPSDVTVTDATSWLLQGRVGRGRNALEQALQRMTSGSRRVSTDDESTQQRWVAAAQYLKKFIDMVPENPDTDLPTLALHAARFLQWAAPSDASGSTEVLCRRLTQIGRRGGSEGSRGPLGIQAQRLARQISSIRVQAQMPRPGRLALSPVADAGYGGRSHIYIIGLAESHFPSQTVADPALNDHDRQRWSLPVSQDRPAADTIHLLRVLRVAKQTTLSVHRLALADGREPYPTPLFCQVERQLQIKPTWQRPTSITGTGCDDLERLLSQRRRSGYAAAIVEAYPWVGQGFRAHKARGRGITRFDGWIGAEADLLSGRTWSARSLETLANCPRRWLWQDALRLSVADEPPRDPRRWLQPMETGNLLHRVFLDFMRYLQDREQTPHPSQAPILQSIVDVAIEQMQRQVPVTLQAAYRNDRGRIELAAQVFLRAEAERFAQTPGLQVVGLEQDFGGDEHPVTIQIGERALKLRGRIDRIDRLPEQYDGASSHQVWDYKTGSTFGFDQTSLLLGGRRLQWALYALVIPQLLGEETRVDLSGYFFASDRGAGQRFADVPPTAKQIDQVLTPLLELASEGLFPAIHKGGAAQPCRFCDFRRICSTEAHDDRGLPARRELMEQWTGLVEGWAQTMVAGRTQASQVVENRLAESGLHVRDIGPLDAIDQIATWMSS